jgi:hypothetical protein
MAWDGAISSAATAVTETVNKTPLLAKKNLLRETGGSDVASGEVPAGGKEATSLDPKPKTQRVASEKMKAALLRARTANVEKRKKVKQSKACSFTSELHQPQFFFDIV